MGKLEQLAERVLEECHRQRQLWGEQNHPDYESEKDVTYNQLELLEWRDINATRKPDWMSILIEEVYEALSETEPSKLKQELIQVAAVCLTWCEAIDRREKKE